MSQQLESFRGIGRRPTCVYKHSWSVFAAKCARRRSRSGSRVWRRRAAFRTPEPVRRARRRDASSEAPSRTSSRVLSFLELPLPRRRWDRAASTATGGVRRFRPFACAAPDSVSRTDFCVGRPLYDHARLGAGQGLQGRRPGRERRAKPSSRGAGQNGREVAKSGRGRSGRETVFHLPGG